ncbi:MAG TPA: TolC family protein [Myxococcaceae bacterium]|nr:TolC family protein [Myxococcaceae bacterium]
MSALVLAAVLAATPIRLEEARTRSRENTQVLLSLLEASMAEQDVRLARAPLLPQLDFRTGGNVAYIGQQRVFSVVPDPDNGGFVQQAVTTPPTLRPNFDLSLSVSQLLFDRGRWAQLRQSGAQLEARQGEAREQADASELEGIQRFYALYRSQATLEVLEANVRRSEQQLERARALFQAGRVGKGEELAAQVNLGNDRIAVVEQKGRLAADQARLAVWLALPGAEPLQAVEPGGLGQEPAPVPELEKSLAEAKSRRPLLVALRQRVRVAELQRTIAQAGYLPRVFAQGSYSRGGPDAAAVFTEPRLQNVVAGGVSLQWNLFEGLATDAQSRRAEHLRRAAELNLAQAERELEGEVRQGHEALQAQLAATSLAAENREAAANALRLAEERFSAGVSSTLEVRDAQLTLTQAELVLLENRIDVEIARFALMRAMGTLGPGDET